MDGRNHQTFRHGAGLSKFCPADGLSNVLSHGSVAVADWQRISKRQSPAQLPGRSSLTSASSQDGSQELEINHNHYESDTKRNPHGRPTAVEITFAISENSLLTFPTLRLSVTSS